MQCISIPECTQRISHLTTSEGNMAKKAKKAKKAKSAVKKTAKKTRRSPRRRSNSRVSEIAGGLMPARRRNLQDRSARRSRPDPLRLRSTKEGVGETSGQTAGSNLKRLRCGEADPAEETGFLRSVRIRCSVRSFTKARLPKVRFGPDVFADALVLYGQRRGPACSLKSPLDPLAKSIICNRVPGILDRPGFARCSRWLWVCQSGR